MHLIECHVARRIIEVTVSGFWTEAQFDAFVVELHAAIRTFPRGGRPPMTLYNYTDAAIQPQAVVARMRALAQHPAMLDRRVAMYTDGVLARQQAKRVADGRDNMRVFDSRDEALRFLHEAPTAIVTPPQSAGPALAPRMISGSITQIKAEPERSRRYS